VDPRSEDITGIGSGFFIRPDGTALTAFHVIVPHSKLIAKLDNGDEFPVTWVNGHRDTDIALIRVTGMKNNPHLELGNSDLVRRGDQVLHVGNTMHSDTTDIEFGYVNKLKDDTPLWLQPYIQGD